MSDILNEAAESAALEQELFDEGMKQAGATASGIGSSQPTGRIGALLPDLTILMSPTGPGSIDDYVDHPINFKKSKGIAQMLRGATGIAGNLDYALIDIGLGAIQYAKEGKTTNEAADRE